MRDEDRLAVATTASHSRTIDDAYLHCFDDTAPLYRYPVTMFVRKRHSTLMTLLNRHLQNAVESGLTEKWKNDILRKKRLTYGHETRGALKNENLFFAWFLCALLIIGSLLILVVERIVHSKRKNNRFWHILHLAINDDRIFLRSRRVQARSSMN